MARMINGFVIVTRQVAATRGVPGPQAVVRAYGIPKYINPVPVIDGARAFERAAQDNASQELLQQAALAVLGRWVPGLGWLLLFSDLYSLFVAKNTGGWIDDCRTGSGEDVGASYWCSASTYEETKAQYNAKRGKPVWAGVWRLAEYTNIRDVPGWPDWMYFNVVAQKHHNNDINNPPVMVTTVPDLPLYGPDPYYQFPHFVDPVALPINRPVPDPVPPPYDLIPNRQPNPERVEQTERGYDYRRQYDANYMPDTLPVSDIAYNPFGSVAFAPADGRAGVSYVQNVLNGWVSPTYVNAPNTQTEPIVVPPFGGKPSGSPAYPGPVLEKPFNEIIKERKHKLSLGGRGAVLIGAFTESLDFLDVLYRSLPGKYNLTKKCKKKRLGVVKKAKLVWEHFDEVQIDKFIVNFTNNQIEDLIYGKAGRGAAAGMRNMGQGHGMQFGTSNNRRLKGDVDAEVEKVARKGEAFDAGECRRLKSG